MKAATTLLAAASLAGCAAPLFRAGFDSDPLGGRPLERPPGPPEDSIIIVARDGGVTVMPNAAPTDRRVLVAANARGGTAQMFAVSAPLAGNFQRGAPVFASWQGFQVRGRTFISLWVDHFFTLALFEIRGGEVRDAGGRTLGRIAGPQSGGGHVIAWQLDPAAATSRLTVFPDRRAGAPTGTAPQTFSIPAPRLADLGRARVLGLLFEVDTADEDSGYYFVDDILIGQRRPPANPPRMAPPADG